MYRLEDMSKKVLHYSKLCIQNIYTLYTSMGGVIRPWPSEISNFAYVKLLKLLKLDSFKDVLSYIENNCVKSGHRSEHGPLNWS